MPEVVCQYGTIASEAASTANSVLQKRDVVSDPHLGSTRPQNAAN